MCVWNALHVCVWIRKKKNFQEGIHSLNDSGTPAPKQQKKKLTGIGNNSAGRQEFFEVNVIFQIDNLHDPDNQLPQQ